jgi:dienelactone hydrolase
VAAWRHDVLEAVRALRARAGDVRVAVVGLRMGATMAMAALEGEPVDSLILWMPYANGTAYVKDTTKLHKLQTMLEPEGFTSAPKGWSAGGEEALGFLLTPETTTDLREIDLLRTAKAPAKQTLIIDGANVPSEGKLADHLRGIGSATDLAHIPGQKFLMQINHKADLPSAAIDEMVRWLSLHHPPDPAGHDRARPAAATPAGAPYGEQPIVFGSTHPLFGILVEPQSRDPRRPAIIMTNAGCVHRIGTHRTYVGMARRWAELGFWVFRIDLSGIGDSPVPEGGTENITYPRDALKDLEDAMACLTHRIGVDKFVVLGLCSGGDLAFQLGFKDERIAGVVMMNPRTFCVNDLDMVDTYRSAGYTMDSLRRVESWKKLLKGRVDVRRSVRTLLPKITETAKRRLDTLVARARATKGEPGGSNEEVRHNDVPARLRFMARRGVDTFLVVSEKDPGVHYVDGVFAQGMQALQSVDGFRRADFPGTDHTFTSLHAQEHVAEVITDHFVRHHAR